MFRSLVLLVIALGASVAVTAQDAAAPATDAPAKTAPALSSSAEPAAAPAGEFQSLDQEVQALKKEVLDLNR